MSLVRVPVLMLVALAAAVTLSAQQTPPPTSLPGRPPRRGRLAAWRAGRRSCRASSRRC